ncbi:MAG: MFS transporter, partial [Bacteroidales bacterium]|nr:MFS transporter [Bacteroidales bacterium]
MPRKRRFSFIPDQFYPVFIRKSFSAWFRQTFRALRSRNYKLFFGGQSISLIGTWMQQIALSWLVYRLTNSVFLLGLVGFSTQIPALLVTPLAGILIDRYNSR